MYAHPAFETIENFMSRNIGRKFKTFKHGYDGGHPFMRLITRSIFAAGACVQELGLLCVSPQLCVSRVLASAGLCGKQCVCGPGGTVAVPAMTESLTCAHPPITTPHPRLHPGRLPAAHVWLPHGLRRRARNHGESAVTSFVRGYTIGCRGLTRV